MTTSLEDLIAENHQTYGAEITGARAVPRDPGATSDLKADEDKMAKLAELAEVEPENIVDCAVRGANVTFMVKDEEGAVSAGFFPLASLSGRTTKRARASGSVGKRTRTSASPQGGAATVPTVASIGANSADADDDNPPVPPPEGVPADIADMSGDKVAALLKDTPEGVDAGAVLAHEFARDEGPRTAVTRAAQKLDMLGEDGQPKTSEADPTA